MKSKLWLFLLPAFCVNWPANSMCSEQIAGPESIVSDEAALPESHSIPCARGTAETAGRIAGVVKDQSGAVVEGVQIEAKHLASGIKRTAVTDDQGHFAFPEAAAGRYEITSIATAFEIVVIRDVMVTACSETRLSIVLRVAPAEAEVEVTVSGISGVAEAVALKRSGTSDTASLFDGVPGLSLATNGGIASLPAIHGMADERVKILVNGMTLASHCSNHMNPAMSYVDPGNVARVNVIAGITPVSRGGDSIGGTLIVDSADPEFASAGQRWVMHSNLTGFHRTNGVVNGGNVTLSAATQHFSAGYTGTYVNAADYKGGNGVRVISSLFQSRTYNAQLGARRGNHTVTLSAGYQDIPGEGFVNAHMDMLKNEARYANAHYRWAFARGTFEARAFYEHTGHLMNILEEKQAIFNMNMPMITKGSNLGYTLEAEVPLSSRDVLRAGTDFHRYTLDDWWPATKTMVGPMGPNTLWNVKDGRRNRFGTYVEWEGRHGQGWTELLGVRSDVVLMDTGNVQGYNMVPTQTGSGAYYADATAFNSKSHGRHDNDFDLAALGRYQGNSTYAFEIGYARKTRAPSLYERYLWPKQSAMSVDMNGWFGDLNGYAGNLDLRPEVAHTVSISGAMHDAAQKQWELRLTPYVTFVQNYVDVSRCPVSENGLGNGCTQARFDATSATLATTPYVTLLFGNYGARIFGVDASGRMPLGGTTSAGVFSLAGVLGYVHGENTDPSAPGKPGKQPLYRMMPLNAMVTVEHNLGNWSSALTLLAVDAKKNFQDVRMELHTPGYVLANLRTSYQRHITDPLSLRLDVGIDNVTGRQYVLPLGGRYYGPTMADIKAGASVPGIGRSFHGGLTFQF